MKHTRFSLLIVLVLLLFASAVLAEQHIQTSFDAGGIKVTVDAYAPDDKPLSSVRRQCAHFSSKQELLKLLETLPIEKTGFTPPQKETLVYDTGSIFTSFESGVAFNLCSASFQQINLDYFEPINEALSVVWHPDSNAKNMQKIAFSEGMENPLIAANIERSVKLAEAFNLSISEKPDIYKCEYKENEYFYFFYFKISLDGIALQSNKFTTGLTDNGSDLCLAFSTAYKDENIIYIECPIISSLHKVGTYGDIISSDKALECLRLSFANQWLPDVEAINIDTMELCHFLYSSTSNWTGAFAVTPAWVFKGNFVTVIGDDSYTVVQVFDAISGVQIY